MSDWKINIKNVPVEHQVWQWQMGNYERYRQHVSVALGNREDHPHPFDVELTRGAPGCAAVSRPRPQSSLGVLHRRGGKGSCAARG